MCDYVYLDGSSATIDSDFMLNWYIDNRILRHYKGNQKVFVSVQQISFYVATTVIDTDKYIEFQTELISNLTLKNSYNTNGRYKVLSLCDSSLTVLTNTQTITTTTSNNNNYMVYEIDSPQLIQLGILYFNTALFFTDVNKVYFKCLLKFEYEDI